MKQTFEEAIANRRSQYQISNESPVADEEIVRIIHETVKHVPSAYNSQSTRIVLLLHDEHKKLWEIGLYAKLFDKTVSKADGAKLFIEKIEDMNTNRVKYAAFKANEINRFKLFGRNDGLL